MPSTSFSEMPTLATSSLSPTPQPFHRRRKSWCRKLERCCCTTFSLFPLVFVYGLTSWAVWVEVTVSLLRGSGASSYAQAGLGAALYSLANLSYTIAVFTSPGSPTDPKEDPGRQRRDGGYEGLPTFENEDGVHEGAVPREWMTTVTAKSTGKPRYCKKCRSVKPDRTHHCSTCGRCVLKMDHHCPWLATCVGLRNYKPFLLFLIYVCLFCYVCFATTAYWVWVELTNATQMTEGLRVINTLLLAILSGIIGLVLSGFLGWHLYLTSTGQTTIESLEKTRYLSPLRKSLQTQSTAGRNYVGQDSSSPDRPSGDDQPLIDRLKEIHANALPGVLRPEEGDLSLESSRNQTPIPYLGNSNSESPARESLQRSFASMEAQRERDRYSLYLDEQDSERLPNAFNVGWKRNLLHVFGTNPFLWWLPICNTTGDGWVWDVSPAWIEARARIGREREQREHPQNQNSNGHWENDQQRGFGAPPSSQRRVPDWKWNGASGFVDQGSFPANHPSRYHHQKQQHQHHNPPPSPPSSGSQHNGGANVQMQALDRRKVGAGLEEGEDRYSADDEEASRPGRQARRQDGTSNWNDIPEDLLAPRNGAGTRSRSQQRRKGD